MGRDAGLGEGEDSLAIAGPPAPLAGADEADADEADADGAG